MHNESAPNLNMYETDESAYNEVADIISAIGEEGLAPIPAHVQLDSLDDATKYGVSKEDAARKLGISL